MNAVELRIGNVVLNQEGQIDTVESIVKYTSAIRINDINDGAFKPIPLTEEWLLRLGFKADWPYFKPQDDSTLELKKEDSGFSFWVDDQWIRLVESVHQLQNLYFALTGEELTMQPETKGPKPYKIEDEG